MHVLPRRLRRFLTAGLLAAGLAASQGDGRAQTTERPSPFSFLPPLPANFQPAAAVPARLGDPAAPYLGAPVSAQEAPAAPTLPGQPTEPTLPEVKDSMPALTPSTSAPEEKKEEKKDEPKSAWLTHPKVQPFPRPGFFPMPPTGAGYYSLKDAIFDTWREKPPSSGYPRFAIMQNSFFDADFRYVDDPKYRDQAEWWEKLHRIHLGDDWLFATGGELRYRYNNENNSRLTGKDNIYDLTRARVFGDLWYRDTFRIYAEFISAQSINQDLPPLLVDRNFADFQNLFIDLKIFDGFNNNPAYLRVGRQELLLGSQRLVSPLDWANTRRTFQGVRAFQRSEKFDVDLFWVQPVVPNAGKLDSVDNNQNFAGIWTTYRPQKTQAIDMYYLFLDNANKFDPVTKTPAPLGPLATAPYNVHSLGSRYVGNKENFLWDAEAIMQLGNHGTQDSFAGATSSGVGYNFKNAPWTPTVWAYFDWASGSGNPKGDVNGTFNQLYPFGHYYFGWLDLVGRQNIQDWNFHLYAYPTNWITFNTQFHVFNLDSATDALYNPAGGVLRRDPTGAAGRNVGQELDLIMNFTVSKQSNILIGYGHLFAGRFIRSTGPGSDPETTWLMYTYRW